MKIKENQRKSIKINENQRNQRQFMKIKERPRTLTSIDDNTGHPQGGAESTDQGSTAS